MKILSKIFLASIVLLLFGCSHNKGGDTRLWGNWKLISITVNGTEDSSYNGNYFWQFQADVVQILEVSDEFHESITHIGTWSFSDDNKHLLLNFTHSDDDTAAGTGAYAPPADIYITEPHSTLDVLKTGSSTLTLSHETKVGLVIYHLKRW